MRHRNTVLTELKTAIENERESTMRVLKLLQEVDIDRHYLEMGFPTLFEFATRELGYSAGAAHRRIQSMRLLRSVPEVRSHIEDGSLSLCVAAKTQGFLRKEERRLKEEDKPQLTPAVKREIAQSMVGASSRDCERKLVAISPSSAIPNERIRVISEERAMIQFTATQALLEKLERLKGLLAHQTPDGGYAELFEKLADLALRKLDPAAATENGRTDEADGRTLHVVSNAGNPELRRSRHIPARVRRETWRRDSGRCTYTDLKSGRACSSQYALELDHIVPFAWGGENTSENLRLRCRAHNQLTAAHVGLFPPVQASS